ncbi:flavin mononucleotide phosphatase [Salinivirga cyanobacteriivorans]|uniref:Flavin mononucleotide phosphatase n=1 Tax=Salinivirga cyanobacteriivorans TaxID=1307839 RepID=A0A0S2I0N6_9BACT|nr:HAD family hydrolase [Salinivirga cyanobacteriivorans]ALO15854.1 flavin mononucleotide phosphatase [Salinivirga cyanobacteriivorans]
MQLDHIKILGFDADDTLWNNETFFREAEVDFFQLLNEYAPRAQVEKKLFEIEMQNLEQYGYGIKSFVLSMTETALFITDQKLPGRITHEILEIGKAMLAKPVKLLHEVEETLGRLTETHELVVATKGDLLDQQRKLRKSGLAKYFHHIEIMPDKQITDYQNMLARLKIPAQNFFMTGNSIKSDILPVLEMGGYAMHVPYHTTWAHEDVKDDIQSPNFYRGQTLADLLKIIEG